MNDLGSTSASQLVSPAQLADLRRRLDEARLVDGDAPIRGIAPARTRALLSRWKAEFDWAAVEGAMTQLGSSTTLIPEGRRRHCLRLPAAAHGEPGLPILLLHGWPDSALMYHRLMPLLAASGHPVVAPTLPGFGWSSEPQGETSVAQMAQGVLAMMDELGHSRFAVHGTDFGAAIAAEAAVQSPERVAALHLLQMPFDRAFLVDRSTATEAEVAFLRQLDTWYEGAAYLGIHLGQADTLAAALHDSPVGLLAWLAEKYDAWSGGGMDDDDIIGAVATMWFSESARSSMRLYSEPDLAWGSAEAASDDESSAWSDPDAAAGAASARVEVPTAFAFPPADIVPPPPRELVDRFFRVERMTLLQAGGHWAALTEPDAIAEDLHAFVTMSQRQP